jgi:hypothetical protein
MFMTPRARVNVPSHRLEHAFPQSVTGDREQNEWATVHATGTTALGVGITGLSIALGADPELTASIAALTTFSGVNAAYHNHRRHGSYQQGLSR